MKKSLFLIFLFTNQLIFAQIGLLKGKWISNENEAIIITDTINSNNCLLKNGSKYDFFKLKLISDTLRFETWHQSYSLDSINSFDFKLLKVNDSILKLKPISNPSISFFDNKKTITFLSQKFIIDKSFDFEKIIFHSSSCFGNCPVINLKIDSEKNIRLSQKNSSIRAAKNYEGKLTDAEYKKFIDLIIKSRITTFEDTDENVGFCCDGSLKTFILYHNGKRKYYKTMFAPSLLDELLSFLYNIRKNSNLEITNQVYKFEK